jgi:hypothetical protein
MKLITLQAGEYSHSPGPGAFQAGIDLKLGSKATYWTPEGIKPAQYPKRMWVQLFPAEETHNFTPPEGWVKVSVIGRYVGFFEIAS